MGTDQITVTIKRRQVFMKDFQRLQEVLQERKKKINYLKINKNSSSSRQLSLYRSRNLHSNKNLIGILWTNSKYRIIRVNSRRKSLKNFYLGKGKRLNKIIAAAKTIRLSVDLIHQQLYLLINLRLT